MHTLEVLRLSHRTAKMCAMVEAQKYAQLAKTITDGRIAAGMTQAALARVLGIKQQSVSRWENGTHRPSIDQMGPLAGALKLEEALLVRLGQADALPALTIAPHLPLNTLAPEMFERFVGDLVSYLYPTRNTRVQGGRGHDQSGWDVITTGDGETTGIQCKQVERLGPAEARRVIAAVDRPVDRSILALSRVISPATAGALEEAGWEVWDQDDISRKVRQLPGELQDNLIDSFFRGQRLTLLGRDNPGPWVKIDRFFAPFTKNAGAFTHDWELVGRETDLATLNAALDGDQPVVVVSGPGGMGKSRLIKTGVERYAADHPATLVRFLSSVSDPDHKSLEALGTGPKLLVVDDAHDREGLPLLIDFVTDPANKARLLLATRPYAEQRIRNDLARFAILKPMEISLAVLSKSAMKELVARALKRFGGDEAWVDVVRRIAADNPLVGVMAARVIAEQELSPEMVGSADEMRAVVIQRFTQVLTGKIGSPDDNRLLRDMLGLIALLQPVRIDDREIGQLLESVSIHSAADATQALKLLIDGGVLYRRGRYYRLMPDLLGDYLIDDICVQQDGRLSLFAERVINSVNDRLLAQVMVNLGRLDWRRNDGDPTDSRLLDAAWARLHDIDHDWDPRIEAARAAAIYQPAQALRFVSDRLRKGKGLRDAAQILSNIAYTERYRVEALQLLWGIGRNDKRETGANPNHPIRALAELCEFGEHKPRQFNEEIAAFAFELMDDDRAWESAHTPFEIVAPLLKGTIDKSQARARGITLSSAFVIYEYARPLRADIINRIIALLEHTNPRIAGNAGRYLHNTLLMPYGFGGMSPPEELRNQYQQEFVATIDRVATLIEHKRLSTTTMLAVADSVDWHAQYGGGPPGEAAERLLRLLPGSLEFRLRAALVDQARFAFHGQTNHEAEEDDVEKWLPALTSELRAEWREPEHLLDQIENALTDLAQAGIGDGSAYMLVNTLVQGDLPLARALLRRASADPRSALRNFVRASMAEMLNRESGEGRTQLEGFLLRDTDMAARVVDALGSLKRQLAAPDLVLLRRAISSTDVTISHSALTALRWMTDLPDRQAVDLALLAPFELTHELLNDVASLLLDRHRKLVTLLDTDDVENLLARMRNIKNFEGYWVEALLGEFAEHFPELFADFLFERTDRALGDSEGAVELLGYRFYEGKLGFHKSAEAARVLDRTWTWLRRHDNDDGYHVYRAAELVARMFNIDDDIVVEFLDAKLDAAGAIELKWIAKLVRHTHHLFPFKQQRFVERYLDRCAVVDIDMLQRGTDALATAAVSGMKSGTHGEPMPRDLQARDDARKVLRSMPRLAPAYALYEVILKNAERDIAQSIREGQILDAEEEE
ncbi:MAG: helix-turn-helix domain-containing protein [Azospirillaceae bacterium]|nr:helix-turn-helix domain-containing protein [Azospirillaceae bacterium]